MAQLYLTGASTPKVPTGRVRPGIPARPFPWPGFQLPGPAHYASDGVHFMKIVTIFFNGNEVSQSMGQLSRNVLTILNLRFDSGNYF